MCKSVVFWLSPCPPAYKLTSWVYDCTVTSAALAVQERVHAHMLCVHNDLQLVSQTYRLHLSELKLFHGKQLAGKTC